MVTSKEVKKNHMIKRNFRKNSMKHMADHLQLLLVIIIYKTFTRIE
jgi:hypothetical protein